MRGNRRLKAILSVGDATEAARLDSPVRLPGGGIGPALCLAFLPATDLSARDQARLPGRLPIAMAHPDWLALRRMRSAMMAPVDPLLADAAMALALDASWRSDVAAVLLRAWALGFAAGRRG